MANLTPRRDDRTYEQLVEVLRRQLPPVEWTDHNASDPGIMLLELLSWLGEMVLYRMDRVPRAHEDKFLNFLIDPPEPVSVLVTFEATFQIAPATDSIIIPAGTLLATDFVAGGRFVFETFQPLTLNRPTVPPLVSSGTVEARAILEVVNEALGVSDGLANQAFDLRPPRVALGITDPDAPAPILTDFVHRTSVYEPNPRVTVGGTPWTPVPSLRTEGSRVTLLNPATNYMVDAFESRIRFGDDAFGAIPPLGNVITCTRYLVLTGPQALSVGDGEVHHLLNFAPPADVALTFQNTDAKGGAYFFSVSRRTELGLREFRAPYRLITAGDFERAILEDFNDFQELSGATPQMLRVAVAFNREPPLEDDLESPGHVTLVLLPGAPLFDETQFRNEAVSVPAKQSMLALPDPLWQRLRRFLDPRRLITTRLHRQTPTLVPITIAATVRVAPERNIARAEAELRALVYRFLSLVSGDFDGRGWRLGRDVYRSQVFRLLEDASDLGVDHVETLTLSPADADGNVVIGPNELPLLQTLTLTVVRV